MRARLALVLGLLTAIAAAQHAVVDGQYWTTYVNATGRHISAFNSAGTATSTFNIPTPPLAGNVTGTKAAGGQFWVADSGWDTLTPYTAAGSGTTIAAGGIVALCGDANGGLWTLSNPANPTLTRRTAQGAALFTVPVPQFLPTKIMGDPFGNVFCFGGTSILKFNSAGAVTGPINVPVSGQAWEIDSAGRLWTVGTVGAIAHLAKYSNTGDIIFDVELPQHGIRLSLDGFGQPRVVTDATAPALPQLMTCDRNTGAVVTTTVLQRPAGFATNGPYVGFEMDGAGRNWMVTNASPGTEIYDANGVFLGSVASPGLLASFLGDRTGLHLVSVLDRGGDADQDGVTNDIELKVGKDPLSSASVPPALVALGSFQANVATPVALSIPADAGHTYVIGASLGTDGVPLLGNDLRLAPLSNDDVFSFWFSPGNTIATNMVGSLDASGVGICVMTVPPGLTGFTVYFAGVTLNTAGTLVSSITSPLRVVLP